MTTVLTPTQTFLINRIGDGEETSQEVLEDNHFAREAEQLFSMGLLSCKDGELLTTAEGRAYLERTHASRRKESFGGLRVVHGHDQSITVEYRSAPE